MAVKVGTAVRVGTAVGQRVRVDPIRCDGHGVCAELFPERIGLDDWGYPLIDSMPIPDELVQIAKRAVSACPALALRLEHEKSG